VEAVFGSGEIQRHVMYQMQSFLISLEMLSILANKELTKYQRVFMSKTPLFTMQEYNILEVLEFGLGWLPTVVFRN
jgi:hypothetical protein